MVERKTIGLREVRNLQQGHVVWDSKIPAFGARRQKGAAVAYVLFYRTKEGRQRWHTMSEPRALPGRQRKRAKRHGAFSAKSRTA